MLCDWADGTILAGDFGRNSETAILIEKLLANSSNLTVITQDAVDYVTSSPNIALKRGDTALVLSSVSTSKIRLLQPSLRGQLHFLWILYGSVDWLHDFTERYSIYLIVKHLKSNIRRSWGKVSTTKLEKKKIVESQKASHLVAWWDTNAE